MAQSALVAIPPSGKKWMAAMLRPRPAARPAAGDVVISDAVDEGINCFKIETDTATYYYDKAGAGFTSILDRDGIVHVEASEATTEGLVRVGGEAVVALDGEVAVPSPADAGGSPVLSSSGWTFPHPVLRP